MSGWLVGHGLRKLFMALNYRPVDRDQLFLVPPDMRDWLPKDHLVWFILQVVAGLNTTVLHGKSKRGGIGREGYDPDMLLGLWIYASARGISSSRQIERACSEDVAFRVLCAQDFPDHTVLARFRQRHQDAMADLFAQVLALCVGQGLGRFGMIAIDGTKIQANASKDKTVSLARLRKLAAREWAKAEATDKAEDAANAPAAGDDVPPNLGSGSGRAEKLAVAIKELEEMIERESAPKIARLKERVVEATEREAKAKATHAASVAKYDLALLNKTSRGGRRPQDDNRGVRDARNGVEFAEKLLTKALGRKAAQADGIAGPNRRLAQRNTTDPQSRVMKTRGGYKQAYNAQLAVTDDHLIVDAKITNQVGDAQQLIPMMAAVQKMVKECADATGRNDVNVGTITADNGYLSQENVDAPGPDRLIAPGRGRIRDGEWVSTLKDGPQRSKAAVAMLEKMKDPDNQRLYKRRSVTVEPVNGHLKDRRGLRQFARRGIDAVDAELKMAAMTTNLMKLFTWKSAQVPT